MPFKSPIILMPIYAYRKTKKAKNNETIINFLKELTIPRTALIINLECKTTLTKYSYNNKN